MRFIQYQAEPLFCQVWEPCPTYILKFRIFPECSARWFFMCPAVFPCLPCITNLLLEGPEFSEANTWSWCSAEQIFIYSIPRGGPKSFYVPRCRSLHVLRDGSLCDFCCLIMFFFAVELLSSRSTLLCPAQFSLVT